MKKSLLLISLSLMTILGQAQEKQPISVDSMLVNISKEGFTSGVLYERVFPWAHLDVFNDTVRVSHTGFFEQALYELYLASNKEKFMSYKDLRGFYSPDSLQNQVDIGVINASFHTVNYNPKNVEEGGLRIGDDSLFVKINNGQPAFLSQHAFVATPLKKHLRVEDGGNVVYRFTPEFLLENTNRKNIVKLTADFGTGTDYVMMQNGAIVNDKITVAYSESGIKTLSFTANFSDESILSTASYVDVTLSSGGPSDGLIENGFTKATIPFTGYEQGDVPLIGRIHYRIFYRDGATEEKIMKPIVIIDGFDPGDKRQIQDSDPHPEETDTEHKSIVEIMTYLNSQNERKRILDTLRAIGYDVVIVNHPTYAENLVQIDPPIIDGGADYIERNAMAHIELYQMLNIELAANNSNEELVIVGPSMGGQISRYALAYMEEKYAATNDPEWQHNTRLWVSVDSPHLGANIPMGVQTLLHLLQTYGAPNVKVNDFVDGQLGSAAAKQQLIEQSQDADPGSYYIPDGDYGNGKTVSQGFAMDRGHPFFIEYYDNLYENGLPGSRGYPVSPDIRKIALINGSLMGRKAFANPYEAGGTDFQNGGTTTPDHYPNSGAQTFKIEGYADFFLGDIHIATLESYFTPATGNNHKIAYFKKKDIIGWNSYDIYMTNNNSRGNMDNVPGGWFNTQQELAKSVEESTPCSGSICVNDWYIRTLEHVGSFIPTVSSLGFINPDFNWHEEFDRNLACPSNPEIPFDNYYGPKINENHTSFTEESVAWLLEELSQDNEFPEPTVYLDGAHINGPSLVCNGVQTTYTIPNCTVSVDWWNHSSNLNVVSSDDNSITVEPAGNNANGEGFVTAHFAHDYAKREFWVGKPDANGVNIENGNIDLYSYGTMRSLYVSSVPEGVTGYRWEITTNSSNPNCSNQDLPKRNIGSTWVNAMGSFYGGHSILIDWGFCPDAYEIRCWAQNACGEDFVGITYITVKEPGSPGDPCAPVLEVYPNPPYAGRINVSVTANREAPCPDEYELRSPLNATIYDMQGNPQYSESFEALEFTITGLALRSGFYILEIVTAGQKRAQVTIIVE